VKFVIHASKMYGESSTIFDLFLYSRLGQNVNFTLYLVCLTAREARNMNPFLATTSTACSCVFFITGFYFLTICVAMYSEIM
jgi:hypothetical protein